MLVTAHQMKAAEEIAFRQGSSPNALMEIAGEGIARCITQFFPIPGTVIVFCGKGHNGGDALVAARNLALEGWRILLRLAAPADELASMTRTQLSAFSEAESVEELPSNIGGSWHRQHRRSAGSDRRFDPRDESTERAIRRFYGGRRSPLRPRCHDRGGL